MANNIIEPVAVKGQLTVGYATANIDANYGPYESLETAQEFLEEERLLTTGLTVGIQPNSNSPITEYWWQGGSFVPKQTVAMTWQ